jgi:hypothetical protein
MNPKEPHSFSDLETWLLSIVETIDSHVSFPTLSPEHCRNVPSLCLWLSGHESPHRIAIEKAADKLWLHEAEAFQDLQPDAASLLRLRIELAGSMIAGFATNQEPPFQYPVGLFQDVVHWLLVDWWNERGFQRAAEELFLRANA